MNSPLTANDAWRKIMVELYHNGKIVSPRGIDTKEVLFLSQTFDMNYPICYHQDRKLNYAFSAAEAYFIAHGDNRVENLAQYNRNISQFSDDGLIFNGSYGPPFNNQLMFVVNTLVNDPNSRQAILTIWKQNPVHSADIRCLSGDTIIHSPEGDLTLETLTRKFSEGLETYPVYSFNPDTGSIELDDCIACWETGIKPIIEIKFENGASVKCTEDHIFYKKNRIHTPGSTSLKANSYIPLEIEARELKIGDRLYATRFLDTLYSGRKIIKNLIGENWNFQNQFLEHRLYAEYLFGDLTGKHVHHIDHNSHNNKSENLVVLDPDKHLAYHSTKRMQKPISNREQQLRNIRLLAKQNAIGFNVQPIEDGKNIQLSFQQRNNRHKNTRAFSLYEKYKSAKNLYEFLALGGYWAELAQDIVRGYCTIKCSDLNSALYTSILDQCFELKKSKIRKLKETLKKSFKVISIRKLKPERVYDFTTKTNHNAVINDGLIAHNCTIALQFIIRDNHIHTKVTMRSSDVWLGIPYDFFNFTIMTLRVLTLVNARLNQEYNPIQLGNMNWSTGSSHAYCHDLDKIRKVIDTYSDKVTEPVPEKCLTDWHYVVDSLIACRDKENDNIRIYNLWGIRP